MFAKPPTPSKNRSDVRPSTPTKSKAMPNVSNSNSSGINSSSSSKVLEEINLLLYLETLKRNRDNEIMLRQKVLEAFKLFEECRQKHLILVAKYAKLVKLASTRNILLREGLINFPVQSACSVVESVHQKLSSGSATDYINTNELTKFKEMLNRVENYENLKSMRSELLDILNATEAIQYSIEAIEISLEKCTTQGLDHFTDTLDMVNYPNLFKEYGNND